MKRRRSAEQGAAGHGRRDGAVDQKQRRLLSVSLGFVGGRQIRGRCILRLLTPAPQSRMAAAKGRAAKRHRLLLAVLSSARFGDLPIEIDNRREAIGHPGPRSHPGSGNGHTPRASAAAYVKA